mgnify:CR=1 FL=1
MKLKHKLIVSLAGGFTLLASALCLYNQTAIYDNAIKTQFEDHNEILGIFSSSLNNYAVSSLEKEKLNFINSISNVQYEALEKFHQTYDKQDLLDFATFTYFAQSNASDQLFETSVELPDSDNCMSILNIPKSFEDSIKSSLKENGVKLDNYWCKLSEGKKFVGYKIENVNDKNYLYTEKLMPNQIFTPMSFNDAISKISLKDIINDSNTIISVVDNSLKVVVSSDNKFRADEIPASFYKGSKEKTLHTELSNNEDREKLCSIKYINDYDVYIVVETIKGHIIKPVVYFNFIILILSGLLASLLIFVFLKTLEKISSSINALTNNVDVMAANVLSGKAKMDKITEKLDPAKQSYIKLKKLTESINSLGRSICENVASKEQEIEDRAKKETVEATENAIYTLVSDIHKDLMPDGSDMPASKFLDIASFIMPSKKKPSDFYDVFRVDKDNIGIVFGACSKSGIAATNAITLCTSFIRKSFIEDNKLPGETITSLNHILMQKKRENFTISIFAMILSEYTGNFIFSQAGLRSPIVVHEHKGQSVEPVETQLEMCSDKLITYVNSKGKFTYLDSMIFAGAGIKDVVNKDDEHFGLERVIELSENNGGKSAYDQLIALYKDSKEFSEEADNDLDVCGIVIKKNAINKEFEE